jgi:hypothetical protein
METLHFREFVADQHAVDPDFQALDRAICLVRVIVALTLSDVLVGFMPSAASARRPLVIRFASSS